jgi:hypothetical protein
MAIEFKCPYCPAIIRVPDNAGGGKGRCPKCAMRLTVPKKTAAKPSAKPAVEEEPFVLPVANEDEETSETLAPTILIAATPVAEAVPVVFDPGQLTKPRIGEIPIDRSPPMGSIAKRLKKKKKGIGPWAIAGAIVFILLGAAAFFVAPQLLTERLTGDLIAGHSPSLELPWVLIEKSRFKLAAEDVATMLSKLEGNPVTLNSSSMLIQLAGTEKGLKVSLAAGPQAHFYRVNIKNHDAVQKYLSRHIAELEDQRTRDVDQAATEFLATYEKVLAKMSPPESITAFRDSLALPSLVGGFGHELVAELGRSLYRCAYEDRDGGLYFLLPEGVKEFRVMGFKHPNGRVVIPAELHVKVEGEIAQTRKPDEKPAPKPSTKKKAKIEDDEKAQDNDEMTGKK